jgi:hypothetical protein
VAESRLGPVSTHFLRAVIAASPQKQGSPSKPAAPNEPQPTNPLVAVVPKNTAHPSSTGGSVVEPHPPAEPIAPKIRKSARQAPNAAAAERGTEAASELASPPARKRPASKKKNGAFSEGFVEPSLLPSSLEEGGDEELYAFYRQRSGQQGRVQGHTQLVPSHINEHEEDNGTNMR